MSSIGKAYNSSRNIRDITNEVSNIKIINISNNFIDEQSSKYIIKGFNNNLEKLNISNNRIGKKGINILSKRI